jgi:hypothetical protein
MKNFILSLSIFGFILIFSSQIKAQGAPPEPTYDQTGCILSSGSLSAKYVSCEACKATEGIPYPHCPLDINLQCGECFKIWYNSTLDMYKIVFYETNLIIGTVYTDGYTLTTETVGGNEINTVSWNTEFTGQTW